MKRGKIISHACSKKDSVHSFPHSIPSLSCGYVKKMLKRYVGLIFFFSISMVFLVVSEDFMASAILLDP